MQTDWYSELSQSVRGPVHRRGDSSFHARSQIFNGNVTCLAKAVVCPLDAQDVSITLKICTKHSLSPSVKAGGYGTAGWAVNGDIIIDLSNFLDLHIAAPLAEPEDVGNTAGFKDYTSIRDMPVQSSKGKSAIQPAKSSDAERKVLKRARSEEDNVAYENPARRQRNYDHASPALATFLHGPALPPDPLGEAPRRLPQDIRALDPHWAALIGGQNIQAPMMSTRQLSGESTASGTSMTSSHSGSGDSLTASSSGGTNITSPDTSVDANANAAACGGDPFDYMTGGGGVQGEAADPFGYMDARLPLGSALFNPGPGFMGPGASSLWASPLGLSIPSPPTRNTLDPALDSPLHRAAEITHLAHAIPVHKHAYVTFGAGVLQKDMDAFTHKNPLEGRSVNGMDVTVPYYVPSAAHPVGSSIMTLGGFGFLSRLHGLSVDNVVEMEVVLADGTIVVASEDSHPDLWWALRGAGPAFGIITRYKVKAYPVPVVFAGNLIYRFHRSTAPSLIRHFRDCIKSVPRELYANVLLTAGPADKDSLVVIQFCYVGPKEKGIEFLQAIESWEGETCLLNEVSEKAFVDQQDSVAQVLRAKAGRNWFIRSALISSLPDEIINKTVIQFADTPIGCTWLFELAGGAIEDFEDTCIPKSRREATWTVASLHQWDLEIDDPRCRISAENWINQTLGPVAVGGSFPSFLGRHEPAARTISCFGESWSRLCELKQRYDGQNVFRNTFWPLAEGGAPVEPETHEPASPVIGPLQILGSA